MDDHITGQGVAIVDHQGSNDRRLTGVGGHRQEGDIVAADHQVGCDLGDQTEGLGGGVVGFAALGERVIRIDHHLNLACAVDRTSTHASGVIDQLHHATATSGDRFNCQRLPNRAGGAAVGGIDNLHDHIGGVGGTVVDHRRIDRDLIARVRDRGIKADVADLEHQVGRRRWHNYQALSGTVVILVAFDKQIIGVGDHLQFTCALAGRGLARRLKGDLGHPTAPGGQEADRLIGPNRDRAFVS